MQLIASAIIVSISCIFAIPNRNANEVAAKPENNGIPPEAQLLTGEALVDYVNKNQDTFKAEVHPSIADLKKKIMKPQYATLSKKPKLYQTENIPQNIPTSFDARTKWPHCPSIGYIRDQSDCGSCWAFASAETMSDRACIDTHGKKKVELSADDILTCCTDCGFGCDGGYIDAAWSFFVQFGVVSGGLYGTKNTCKPYEIAPCGIHPNQTFYGNCTDVSTPKCTPKCQAGYPLSYKDDKTYGKTSYAVRSSVSAIQHEIMTRGPVVAAFFVFEDFFNYKHGVYQHVAGDFAGGHAVRIIGWGVEKGVPYWLVANSWNTDWGENGYFRIRRGTNECGIEESVYAGQL